MKTARTFLRDKLQLYDIVICKKIQNWQKRLLVIAYQSYSIQIYRLYEDFQKYRRKQDFPRTVNVEKTSRLLKYIRYEK